MPSNQSNQVSAMEQQLLREYQEMSRLCQVKCRQYAQMAQDEQVRSLLQEIERNERQNELLASNVLNQSGTSGTQQ